MSDMEQKKTGRKRPWMIALAVVLAGGLAAGATAGVRAVQFDRRQQQRIETVIASAEDKLGLPYVLNEEGPHAYDCSSLVQACFADAGVELPRNSRDIGEVQVCRVEDIALLQRGDIVCWDTVNDQDLTDHLGIYLGEGQVLHASTGRKLVVIDDMEGYFTEHFSWALRPIERLPYDIPLRGLWDRFVAEPEENQPAEQ